MRVKVTLTMSQLTRIAMTMRNVSFLRQKGLASLGILGDQLRAPCNPLDHHSTLVLMGLRRAVNWNTMMPRDASLSDKYASDSYTSSVDSDLHLNICLEWINQSVRSYEPKIKFSSPKPGTYIIFAHLKGPLKPRGTILL